MIKNKFIVLLILMLLLPSFANAISIGVSPGRVSFDNLLKEGYAERVIKVSTNSADPVMGSFSVSGDIGSWLRFEPENLSFAMSSGNPYELKIIIEPPIDARSDSYSAGITFVTDRFGDIQGRAGGFVKAGVKLIIGATVSDEEIIKCNAGGFSFDDLEIGFPLKITSTIVNDGNVRIEPEITFDIMDQTLENLVMTDTVTAIEILPTTTETITTEVSTNLDIGQYFGRIQAEDCGSSGLLEFSVVEKGGIVDKGFFEGIYSKLWAYVDEAVEIKAVFRNDGPRTVSTKFKGNIKLDNKIIEVIETEEIDVPAGETTSFITFFTPEEPGRYIISGRMHYNRKITFEKEKILNINYLSAPGEKRPNYIVPLVIYIALIVTIIFLLRKILKTRKKKKHF